MKKYIDRDKLQEFTTKLTNKYKTMFSSPLVASSVAEMTDTTKVYVYVGSETGYTSGNWYYWNGTAWTSGGVYNAVAVETDTTLSVSGKAADAKAVGDEISDVNDSLDKLAIVKTLNAQPWTQGWIRTDGTDGDATNICRTVNMFSLPEHLTVIVKDGFKMQLHEYATLDDLSSYIGRVNDTYASGTTTYTIEPSHFYRFTVMASDESRIYYYDLSNDTVSYLSNTEFTDVSLSMEGKAADAKSTGDYLHNIDSRFAYLNLFNKDASGCLANYYLNTANGQPSPLNTFSVSDFIDISNLSTVKVSYTHIICFYNENKEFVSCPSSMDSRNSDLTLTIPSGVKYLRFSTNTTYFPVAQIGENVVRNNYVPFGKYLMPDLLGGESAIIVDASGNGDYTSFTEAVYNNVNSGVDIIVKPGTYDIKSEYVALFGSDVIASLSDSTDLGGFQYGVILRNRKIIFETGARLVCDFTGNTIDGSHRFSALRVDYNVEIIGLNLNCIHTFYAIHDDYGLLETPYTVKYKNCVVNAENLIQQNVIGGGCKKYSRHIIEDCYFNNGENSNIHTVRYHNTNQSNAIPEIFVSNTYFNGTFTARWYGTQTTKMSVYVNNCKARTIYTMQEAEGYTEENVEMFKWCNEETNPIT